MADAAPAGLSDFFAKNKKKKVKGSNLNAEASKGAEEEKKKTAKDKDEDKDEEVNDAGLKVQVAGKLMREDEKKEEADHSAPVWKTKNTEQKNQQDDRRFPSLRKAVGMSSNINIDDGSGTQVNIKTSKNAFQALHNDDDDDDEGQAKRPQEIKPFLATKQKGEMLSTVIQREVDKYGGKKGESSAAAAPEKKKKKKKGKEVETSSEEEESDDEKVARKKKEDEKKAKQAAKAAADNEEDAEDVKIQPDLEESRRKYQGRQKLPKRKLPQSEMEEESKRGTAAAAAGGKKGKKKNFMDDEDDAKPKLMVAPKDW